MKPFVRYQVNIIMPEQSAADLGRIARTSGVSPTRYAREAVLEKLARDVKQIAPANSPAEQPS